MDTAKVMDVLNSTDVTLKSLPPQKPGDYQKPVSSPRPDKDFFGAGSPLLPENLPETVSRLRGPGVAQLRSKLSGQFGVRLKSTGDTANPEQTRIVMQTLDASPENPYLVEFDQFILDPFTGSGQFDLVECDASDVDGEDSLSEGETIATKSGFTDGVTTGSWSHFSKVITVDKVYGVVFVPGTAGDGIFSIKVRALYPGFIDPDQTPLPA